jgi:hypothetical protein
LIGRDIFIECASQRDKYVSLVFDWLLYASVYFIISRALDLLAKFCHLSYSAKRHINRIVISPIIDLVKSNKSGQKSGHKKANSGNINKKLAKNKIHKQFFQMEKAPFCWQAFCSL